ncbi:ABC transporter substrate-binding protein [Tropicimonas isoalkanivorans]|uniref:Peptide/nickel transport system substrate-binding protein n=1 Tax=Tropicimonas isoalkanivorans TaxID=441112 RepID=A0A1I1KPK7_9RHOB|nr:ABC transporter substrate-binding protein [Tropicimonas isoalkanivorans]SFC62717.1 peptide/nickel transport system substrate-binding protein [Tropicimonas isoalkanivorans]
MTNSMTMKRRTFLAGLAATGLIPATMIGARSALAQTAGGILRTPAWPAPTYLNSAISTGGPESFLSPKFYDGLLGYAFGMEPKPSLATEWSVSDDGMTITFKLRDGVKWHDGEPFTAHDVAFTFMEILKVHHGRGKSTFAALESVDTPDDHTAIFNLSKPTPALMRALDSRESPIMPAHLYEGTDIMENPVNTAPVGTGPFKLASYEIGANVVMVKNEDYWHDGYPLLDRIVVQYIADPSTRAAMLEGGQADAIFLNMIPAQDILRLAEQGQFEMTTDGFEAMPSAQQMSFNLDNEILADKLVRHAIAHAIDVNWITQNVWYGMGQPGKSPLHFDQKAYFTTNGVPSYPFNLDRANELLDEAGYPRGADGMRFGLMLDPSPWGTESITASSYIKEVLRQAGIDVTVRTQDFAVFVKTVWTDRAHDLVLYTASMGVDPTIGVHRFYDSNNFNPGVGFSNGSHYSNPQVDELLAAAAVETDEAKRAEQYAEFQRIAYDDLPVIKVTDISMATIANVKVKDHTVDALGALGSMKQVWIEQ